MELSDEYAYLQLFSDSATIINIVGVHKDEITVTVKEGEDSYLISVRLLDGYF